MGVKNDPTGRGCCSNEETVVHILFCVSVKFTLPTGLRILGRHHLKPWELHDIPVRCLLNFAWATGLF